MEGCGNNWSGSNNFYKQLNWGESRRVSKHFRVLEKKVKVFNIWCSKFKKWQNWSGEIAQPMPISTFEVNSIFWVFTFLLVKKEKNIRGCLYETRNELSTHHKRNPLYIVLLYGRSEIKFRFGSGPRKTAHLVKVNHFCFDEISASANVYFHMISFRVAFT